MTLLFTFTLGLALYYVLWSLVFNRAQFLKPFRYRTQLTRQERKRFEREFRVFLVDVVRLIQAGIPLNESLKIAAQDNGLLVKEAIVMPLERIAMGEKSELAWAKATTHFETDGFDQFVMILELQKEVGGKISEMLESLIEMLRRQDQLRTKIRTLTTEGRLSGIIMGALPPGLLAVLFFLSPAYLNEFLAHNAALPLLGLAGLFWMMGVYFLVKLNRGLHG